MADLLTSLLTETFLETSFASKSELEASDLRHSSSCLGICLEELVVEGSEDVAKSTVSAAGIKELRPEEIEAANRPSTASRAVCSIVLIISVVCQEEPSRLT